MKMDHLFKKLFKNIIFGIIKIIARGVPKSKMDNPYRVGIYLRLSKEDERLGESGSITNQRAILMNYIKEHQLTFVKEYVDDGVSGTTFHRLGFNQMIQDIEDHKINMILTKDTSRLGRDHIEFGYYVEKYFPEKNVRYVAVCDNIDTISNNNDMLLFKSAYNDMYVKDISNKIRASLNIKKQNGEFVGAYAPYGYQKSLQDKHRLVIDEEAAQVVKRIFQLFIEGNSISNIAFLLTEDKIKIPSVYQKMNRGLKSKLFGIWTARTITDILTNPTYQGDLTQGRCKKINYKSKKRIHTKEQDWIICKNACPAIISRETFALAKSLYTSNRNHATSSDKPSLLLRGLVYCKECNHTIGFRTVLSHNKQKKAQKRIYGNCNYYLKKRKYQSCTPHSISYLELEQKILKIVSQLSSKLDKNLILLDFKKKEQEYNFSNNFEKEKNKLQKDLELEKKKRMNLYEDKLSEFITKEQYLQVDHQLHQKINLLQEKLKKIKEEEQIQRKLNKTHNLSFILDQYLTDRNFLFEIIKKITISESGKIEIYFKVKSTS